MASASTVTTDRPVRLPPGPLGNRLVDVVLDKVFTGAYVAGLAPLAEAALKRGPGAVTLNVPGFGRTVVVTDPALAKEVFAADPEVLLGGEGVGPAAAIYGSGSMFVKEEPEHLRRRKVLTPPLHGRALAAHQPAIAARTSRALNALADGERLDLLPWLHALTLDIIVEVVFGTTDDDQLRTLGEPFAELLKLANSEEVVARYALRHLGAIRYWPARRRIRQAVDDVVHPLIEQRRTAGDTDTRHDILSLLMAATDEDGGHLTDSEVRDDLITLVIAGHETTSTTLAWAIDLLLHHPRALRRVQAEAGTDDTTYTMAVLNETLRLRPAVAVTGRVTAARFPLGDWVLPPGTRVVPYIPLVNRDPATHADPDEFRPDRFVESRPQSHAWIPFGGGLKRCLGAAFSMAEMTTMLHTILTAGSLEPRTSRPARPLRKAAVVVPHNGVPVRWRTHR